MVRRDIIWEDIVGGDIIRRDVVRRRMIILVLLTREGMLRRVSGVGKVQRRRQERVNVRMGESWEGWAHRFSMAAGFSPGKKLTFLGTLWHFFSLHCGQ